MYVTFDKQRQSTSRNLHNSNTWDIWEMTMNYLLHFVLTAKNTKQCANPKLKNRFKYWYDLNIDMIRAMRYCYSQDKWNALPKMIWIDLWQIVFSKMASTTFPTPHSSYMTPTLLWLCVSLWLEHNWCYLCDFLG